MKKFVSYCDIVNNLTDLKALASIPEKGLLCSESSAYNKLSKYNAETDTYEHWEQNWDEGLDAPRSEDGGYVIADMKGPGAIVRIWSADPKQGHIKIFIDDNENPVIDMPFYDLFGAAQFPFNLDPLCYTAAGGKNCFVPISYNESCKVILYDDWGRFYQVNYITYPERYKVEPFTYPLGEEQSDAINKACEFLNRDFSTLSANLSDSYTVSNNFKINGNQEKTVFSCENSGAVAGIKIKLNNVNCFIDDNGIADDWTALSNLAISVYYDGNKTPAVWTTLGGFFASQTGLNPYNSMPLGITCDGTMYCNWYMPFENGIEIKIQNDGDVDYDLDISVTTQPLTRQEAEKRMRFHANQVRAKDPIKNGNDRWPDSEFLGLSGRGRFVGTSLHVYKEIGSGDPQYYPEWWWGEGDEKFFVDGEKFPSWFGTGSEDYFGYAWGTWFPFARPYHAQPFTNGGMFGIGNRLNSRFHIIDNIPFQKSFSANLEKYHRDGYCNWVFTNFFYLEKECNCRCDEFSLKERTAYYSQPFPAVCEYCDGENLKILNSNFNAETMDMSEFGNNWTNNTQFILRAWLPEHYVKFSINIGEEGRYKLTAALTKAPNYGIATHLVDDIPLGDGIDLYCEKVTHGGEFCLGETHLTKGLHTLTVKMLERNPLSSSLNYGLDYLKIEKL